MELNAICDASFFRTLLQNVQHLLLEVNSNNTTFVSDELGQGNEKEPRATAHVHDFHAPTHIWPEDHFRPVKEAPKGDIEQVDYPPRGDMICHSPRTPFPV